MNTRIASTVLLALAAGALPAANQVLTFDVPGSAAPDGDYTAPLEAAHRFFKVSVER